MKRGLPAALAEPRVVTTRQTLRSRGRPTRLLLAQWLRKPAATATSVQSWTRTNRLAARARPCIPGRCAGVGAARSRCRGAAALLPEAKHQPRPSDAVLAHLRADDREQAAPHTHRARGRIMGATVRGCAPSRCNLEIRRPPARTRDAWFATHSAVLPRAADGCIARMMRKPNGARTPRCCFRRASGCWFATRALASTGWARRSPSRERSGVRWSDAELLDAGHAAGALHHGAESPWPTTLLCPWDSHPRSRPPA